MSVLLIIVQGGVLLERLHSLKRGWLHIIIRFNIIYLLKFISENISSLFNIILCNFLPCLNERKSHKRTKKPQVLSFVLGVFNESNLQQIIILPSLSIP